PLGEILVFVWDEVCSFVEGLSSSVVLYEDEFDVDEVGLLEEVVCCQG
ncbi:11649_t:CDS:2, partial [Acaulospora colombiana]